MASCPSFNLTGMICGTQVSVHWLWIIFYALAILGTFTYNMFIFTVLVIVLDGPILLFTITTMMIGISMMVKATGGTTEGILIFPFWGFTKYGCPYHNKGPNGDLMIALAGPLTCVAMGAAWFGLFFAAARGEMFYFRYYIYEFILEEHFFATLFCQAVMLNVVLFILNILPAYPLAGGRILAAIMLMRNVEKSKVALITGKTGIFVALCGCIYGLVAFFVWKNPDAIFVFVTCIVVVWYSMALIRRVAEGTLDDHQLFLSSNAAANNGMNTGVNMAPPQVPSGNADTFEAGEESQTSSSKPWWKFGGKGKETKKQGTATSREPEIDYGY